MHDPRAEAARWWEQAIDDRLFVQTMAREARFFDKACFIAQQAAEKAVKACLYAQGKREVLGHAVLQFTRDLARSEPTFSKIATQAARLDRHYIPKLLGRRLIRRSPRPGGDIRGRRRVSPHPEGD